MFLPGERQNNNGHAECRRNKYETTSKILRVQLLAPGVFAPSGYNGRGVGPGTVIGKHLADTIVSGNRDDFPFPIEALYREKWSSVRAAYYSYGTLALQFVDRW